jgi:predicted dehydrogenase
MIKYKVGIIGCGNIFARHLEAINLNNKQFKLVSICDIDPIRLNICSAENKVPGFLDYKEMLQKMGDKLNFVVIATPNSFHFEQAIDSLKAGKDILVEKPIDFLSSRALKIDKEAFIHKKNAYSVLQVRYNPTLNLVIKALNDDYLGKIKSVSLIQRWQRPEQYFDSWRSDIKIGGRTLYEVGIHYLDIMQWLFGLPEVKASASFSNKHTNIVFEDTVFAILKFPSGASGSIEVTIAAEPTNLECSLSILGSEGHIKIGGKALDKIETALFSNVLNGEQWNEIVRKADNSLSPNSYGAYSGSCPNHPTLYREIAAGRGISLREAANSIKFIESIYAQEVK